MVAPTTEVDGPTDDMTQDPTEAERFYQPPKRIALSFKPIEMGWHD